MPDQVTNVVENPTQRFAEKLRDPSQWKILSAKEVRLSFVRTVSPVASGGIAVETENSEPIGKLVSYEPLVEIGTIPSDLFSVPITAAVDMVNSKKFKSSFPATDTQFSPVSGKNFLFELYRIAFSILFSHCCVLLASCFPRSRMRAAVSTQARASVFFGYVSAIFATNFTLSNGPGNRSFLTSWTNPLCEKCLLSISCSAVTLLRASFAQYLTVHTVIFGTVSAESLSEKVCVSFC